MESFWWYVARSSGFSAFGLLTASVLWGIALSSPLLGSRKRPPVLNDLHQWLGGLAVVFTVLHLVALWADSFVTFTLPQLLVPFLSTWNSTAVALGIVGFWLLVAVELTSLLRARLGRRAWRAVHGLSYGSFWAAALHGVLAGTDATAGWYVGSVVASVGAVMILSLHRALTRRTRAGSAGA